MNKHCHRVIFSKTLQCLVVTSELAKNESTSSSAKTGKKTTALLGEEWIQRGLNATLTSINFALFSVLGFVFIAEASANDIAIRADKNAPGNQQATILKTANGIPQVNIQTPSAQGVSRNVYSQFDVSEKGAVLNNSRKGAASQLAGHVSGNQHLARGEAKVILNEVNSNNPSQLKGYIEVAGKKADVVIANPSGLHCDGCGVINAGRTTLTTGKVVMDKGDLTGFEVRDGKITVGSKGMDNTQSDYTDIIAKKTKIDGQIKGNKIKVITGKNRVSRDGGNVVYIGNKNDEKNDRTSANEYSVDVSELGGMYAGQIQLVDNGQGLGVRNAGHIGASVGDIQIDSKGKIVNSGVMQAQGNVKQKAKRKIENSGTLVSRKGNIKQQSDDSIKQNGVLIAKGDRAQGQGVIEQKALEITQTGNTAAAGDIRINGQNLNISKDARLVAGMVFEEVPTAQTSEAQITQNETPVQEVQKLPTFQNEGSRIELTATNNLSAQGQFVAQHAVQVSGAQVDLSQSQVQSYNLIAKANDNLTADEAKFNLTKQAVLEASNALSTQNIQLSAEQIQAKARSLNNSEGQWQQTGSTQLDLHFASLIKNRGGQIQTAGDLSLNTANLDNTQGKLIAPQQTLEAGMLNNTEGLIVANNQLAVNSGKLDNTQGVISSGKDKVTVNTKKQDLINTKGTLSAATTLNVNAGKVANVEGKFSAEQQVAVNALSLDNSQGRIISTAESIALDIAQRIINQEGVIAAQSAVQLNGVLDNSQGGKVVSVADSIVLNGKGGTSSNQKGEIRALKNITFNARGLNNDSGAISAEHITLNSKGHQVSNRDEGKIVAQSAVEINGDLDNQKGQVISLSDKITINSNAQVNNQAGKITSAGASLINAQGVNNDSGVVSAEHITLNSKGHQVSNRDEGKIVAQSAVEINGDLDNQKGQVISLSDKITINSNAQVNNQAGKITSAGASLINARGLNNDRGVVSGDSVSVNSKGHQVSNRDEGKIVAQSAVEINGDLDNQKGQVISLTSNVVINSDKQVDNRHGTISAAKEALINSRGFINDNGGKLLGEKVSVNSKGYAISNQSGVIQGTDAVTLNGNLDNAKGRVLSTAGEITVNSDSRVNNQSGEIRGAKETVINGQGVDNRAGYISGGSVRVNSSGSIVDNRQGGVISGDNGVTLNGNLNNEQGKVLSSAGDVTINSHSKLNNKQGVIQSAGKTSVNGTGIDNQNGLISGVITAVNALGGQIDNRQGVISGENSVTLDGKQLDNREGLVIGRQGDVKLNIETVNNQAVSDKGSLISAGNTLTLNGKEINNQNTKAQEGGSINQGIIARNINGNLTALHNQRGNFYALDNATLKVSGDVHNEGGLMRAGKQLDILGSKQTLIHNKDGVIEGVGGLAVEANNFNDEGTLRSQGLGRLALQIENYEYNKKFDFGALDFSVNGTLTNNVDAVYDHGVTFRAKNVKNNGTIGGYDKGKTQILATEKVENRGLIDGQFTLVKGEKITNTGTGRIYGDHLAMEAKEIYNGAETVKDGKGLSTKAGTIAGREHLALAFEKMANADGSTVMSFGSSSIGRKLNENYQAVGKADSLDNSSGVINLTGNAKVSVGTILNRDSHIERQLAENGDKITLEQYQKHRAPSQFLVGGDLDLETDKFHNKYSQVMVGGVMMINGRQIDKSNPNAARVLEDVLINEDLSGKVYQVKESQVGRGFIKRIQKTEETIDNLGLTDNPPATIIGTNTSKAMTEQIGFADVTPDNISIKGQDGNTAIHVETTLSEAQRGQVVRSGAVVAHIFDTTIKGGLLTGAGVTELKDNQDKTNREAASNRRRGTYLEDIRLGTVRTHLSDNPNLPTASYLQINQNDPTKPLVSVDPILTKGKSHLNADYLLHKLGQTNDTRRLGDGFYEQQLVSRQVNELTGRRFLSGQHSDSAQYETLMNNGVNAAQSLGLEVGKGLTAEQMSKLTQDIVWFVEQERVVPLEGNVLSDNTQNDNGRTNWRRKTSPQPTTQTIKVLIPQVYTVSRPTDVINKNAVISADSIVGTLNGKVNNSGAISAVNLNRLHADSFNNSGLINGTAVDLKSKGDFINLGGQIEASKQLLVQAGGKLEGISTEKDIKEGNTQRHLIDKQAVFKVTDSDGLLALSSDKDMLFKGAKVSSGGDLFAHSKENLIIDSVRVSENTYTGGGDNFHRTRKEQDVGSEFQAVNNLTLIGDKSIYTKAAQISSDFGRVHLQSKGDVTLDAGLMINEEESKSKSKKRRRLGTSKKTSENYNYHYDEYAQATLLKGENVSIAGNNITLNASQVLADKNINVQAQGKITVDGVTEKHQANGYHAVKKSSFTSSLKNGIARLGFVKADAHSDLKGTSETFAGSAIVSKNGNIVMLAKDSLTAKGAYFDAGKDIYLQGSEVKLITAKEKGDRYTSEKSRSRGIGISLVYNPIQVMRDNYRNQAAQGSAKTLVGKITTFGDAFTYGLERTFNGVGFTAHAKRQHESGDYYNEHAVTNTLKANGNLTLRATDGSIYSQGGEFIAQGNADFIAKDSVIFDTATHYQSRYSQRHNGGIDIDTAKNVTAKFGVHHQKTLNSGDSLTQEGATLSVGGKTRVIAQNGNAVFSGVNLVSDNDVTVFAKGDVKVLTAENKVKQDRNQTHHSIGEVAVSDTERFAGYNRIIHNQDGEQVSHQGSRLASLNGSVKVYAGGDYLQKSAQILAKEHINISAEKIRVEGEYNNQREHQHDSDLKIGQFSRVISPFIDLVQSAERTVKTSRDEKASDRLKAAELLGLAAQGYTVANAVQGVQSVSNALSSGIMGTEPVLLRVESGTGFSHSRSDMETTARQSVGNVFNAKHIQFSARSGDIHIEHADITTRDKAGNRIAGSTVSFDAAKNIYLGANEDAFRQRGKSQSAGLEVGTAVSVGAKTGWSIYGKVGYGAGKYNETASRYQNSFIDTDTLSLKSKGDTTLSGTTALARTIYADVGGTLKVESLQDAHHKSSRDFNAGIKVEFGIGSSWDLRLSASGNRANSHFQQVGKQAGLFAEEGGYHIKAKHTNLAGGAISSTNPANSQLITNSLTFSDITNESAYRATSASVGFATGKQADNTVDPTTGNPVARNTEGGQVVRGESYSTPHYGLPMYESGRESGTTRATLTEGTIILNKDSTPTQTTAAALGINTDMHSANTPVSAPKEIQRELQEQVQLRDAVGHIATGIDSYIAGRKQTAGKEAEALTQEVARLQRQGDTEKIGEKQTALKLAEQEKTRWETGGDYKRNADIVKALVTTSIAGKAPTEIAVSAASPIVNNYIKDVTKENLPANLLAHAAWSALEAKTAGSDAVAGAVAGGGGELLAHTAATFLYDVDGKTKTVAHLTETEKNNLNALSQLGAGIVGGIIGDNSYSAINSAQIAQRAVENNYLFVNEAKEKAELERKIQQGTATQEDKERHAQLNALDITRDNRVTVACRNKLSSSCQTERVLLNQAYAGYFANSTASNYYGYPVYTRNNLLYSQDADKVAGFVAEYDLLKALKEQNIRDLANKYNLDENRIKQWESWLNVGANVTAGIAGHKLATTTPAVIPKGTNANEKLPITGTTKGYGNQSTIINGESVQLKGFKGATSEGLERFNNFLSNTIDTTTGKGVRNATKPNGMSIKDDWNNLTQGAIIKSYDNGRQVAIFGDGTQAVFRSSTTGPMTIELQRQDGKKIIEVRYDSAQ